MKRQVGATLFLGFSLFACGVCQAQTSALQQSQLSSRVVSVTPPKTPNLEPSLQSMSRQELEDRGDADRVKKNYLDAMDAYQASLKKAAKGRETAILYNKIGITHLQTERYDEAKKSFERASKADKTYADAYNNAGVVQYIKKKYGRAVKQYRKAIVLRDNSSSFHSNLGSAYFSMKEFDKAVAEYQRAMDLDPSVFDRRSAAGVAAQLSSPEDRAHYAYVVARMFAQMGNFEKSLFYLRRALEDGYKEIDDVYKDSQFAELRKDQRFTDLMTQRPMAIPQ